MTEAAKKITKEELEEEFDDWFDKKPKLNDDNC